MAANNEAKKQKDKIERIIWTLARPLPRTFEIRTRAWKKSS